VENEINYLYRDLSCDTLKQAGLARSGQAGEITTAFVLATTFGTRYCDS
jgi:hypothetical protein